jgi:hypothetical protein
MKDNDAMLSLLQHNALDEYADSRYSVDAQTMREIRHVLKPWYLEPTHQILLNGDGSVQGGTLPALIEYLTMHDRLDAAFVHSFMATFQLFTTTDELFRLLVAHFKITHPPGIRPGELQEWMAIKQAPLKLRYARPLSF